MNEDAFKLLRTTLLAIVAILLVLLAVVGFIAVFMVNSGDSQYKTAGQSAQTAMNIYKIEDKTPNVASPTVINYQAPQVTKIQEESTRLNVNTRINVHVSGYTPYPRYYQRYPRYYNYNYHYYPVRYASPNYLVHWGSYQY
ncbi:MAG: hypothetical protein AABW64_02355 [Nanoarchaeota archaeon]